ncbi:glycoside hydrolase family 5 protein [Tulasnella calospora MUT 4182]|uniref:Glycoside hydrolase family 5 protein n=1 Tax=Tulasnella calospora MUT 4182 TaxID=1051891 RepID=A0A0C3QS28_9AGAM|nr:glycoside hydrolase family 5 protein [Tulasnella calospora MUT 4182]
MKFNVTIASPSPLISSGSLIFNGTMIWLYSLWGAEHIGYFVYLDSLAFGSTHFSEIPLLYDSLPLDQNKEHTVTVQPARLLKSAIVEMDLGDETDMMISLDGGQLFEQVGFVATGSWNTDACLAAGRVAGMCYVSEGSGSIISYTFEGDAITLWGIVENSNSLYQVSVDGVQPVLYTPSNITNPLPIIVLAHYSNLGPGSHTLRLTSLPKDGRSRIEVDYVQVYTMSSTTSESSPTTVGQSTVSSTAIPGDAPLSHLSKSATIAIIIGALLGVLALVGLFFLYKLRQKNTKLAATRKYEAAVAAAGVREDFSLRRSRDFDEATLASSRFSVKEGLELSVVESQTETRKSEEAAKGGFTWRS